MNQLNSMRRDFNAPLNKIRREGNQRDKETVQKQIEEMTQKQCLCIPSKELDLGLEWVA